MKHPPLAQQSAALSLSRDRAFFAFFMEQGTGKAYVGLAEAEALFTLNRIDALVVVAPNGVQRNWLSREAPKHLSIPFSTLLWTGNHTEKYKAEAIKFVHAAQARSTPNTLPILAFNIEAFSVKRSKAEVFLMNVLRRLRCLLILDESSVIKNGTSQCTRAILRVAPHAPFRRIMTGTPVTQSPFNFFYQMKFLAPGLLGFTEFQPFKAFFAEWRTRTVPDRSRPGTVRSFPELVHYRNLHILKERVDKHSFSVKKADCLDLPPKIYETRLVEPTPAILSLYNRVRKATIVEFEEGRVTLAHAFTRLTRLAQILGGFVQLDSTERVQSVPGPNPKIDSLLQFIEELDSSKKVIIWARFTAELLAIEDALGAHNCVMYHGSVDDAERHAGVDRFQERAECRFFVGNAQAGRFGLTLTAASHVVYFSNNFSAETRWQSEDRAHRIGQTESVLYTDLIVPNTIDEKILGVLRARKSLADVFKDSRDLARWLSDSIPEEVT